MDCEGSQHRSSILSKVLETRFVRQVPLYMQLKQTQTCTLTHSSFPFDLLFLSLPLHLCSFHHPQSVCSTFKDFFNAWIFSEKGVLFFFFLQRICLSQRSVVWFFFKDLQKKRRQSGTCECRPASSCALQNGDKLLHSSRSFHYTFSPADIAPSVTQGLLITCRTHPTSALSGLSAAFSRVFSSVSLVPAVPLVTTNCRFSDWFAWSNSGAWHYEVKLSWINRLPFMLSFCRSHLLTSSFCRWLTKKHAEWEVWTAFSFRQ